MTVNKKLEYKKGYMEGTKPRISLSDIIAPAMEADTDNTIDTEAPQVNGASILSCNTNDIAFRREYMGYFIDDNSDPAEDIYGVPDPDSVRRDDQLQDTISRVYIYSTPSYQKVDTRSWEDILEGIINPVKKRKVNRDDVTIENIDE